MIFFFKVNAIYLIVIAKMFNNLNDNEDFLLEPESDESDLDYDPNSEYDSDSDSDEELERGDNLMNDMFNVFNFDDLDIEEDIEEPVIELNNIEPANCSTVRDYLRSHERVVDGDIVRPPIPLHRMNNILDANICIVNNCNEVTSNDCRICCLCHPTQEVDNFPCFLSFN